MLTLLCLLHEHVSIVISMQLRALLCLSRSRYWDTFIIFHVFSECKDCPNVCCYPSLDNYRCLTAGFSVRLFRTALNTFACDTLYELVCFKPGPAFCSPVLCTHGFVFIAAFYLPCHCWKHRSRLWDALTSRTTQSLSSFVAQRGHF